MAKFILPVFVHASNINPYVISLTFIPELIIFSKISNADSILSDLAYVYINIPYDYGVYGTFLSIIN